MPWVFDTIYNELRKKVPGEGNKNTPALIFQNRGELLLFFIKKTKTILVFQNRKKRSKNSARSS